MFRRKRSPKLPAHIQRTVMRKLTALNAAPSLNALRVPPGNLLEPLAGDREGQHSIRINDLWRICFRWHEGNASDGEVTDYHWKE
ncbi:MAG: type II toxin-antitoxin system RelE/ParE family toxin [Syntrophobacteraceae bacterium]